VACTGTAPARRTSAAPLRTATTRPAPAPRRQPRLQARTASWRLPSARSREVVVETAGGLVVAGGLDGGRTTTSTVWLLDPGTGRVRATGRLATAVHDATGFALDGVPYVVAGGNETTYDVVQRVNTS